jgi:hypothetical protein
MGIGPTSTHDAILTPRCVYIEKAATAAAVPTDKTTNGMQHPSALPTLRCRPERVSGIPILRESLLLAADKPLALFQDHEKPNLFFRRPIATSLHDDFELDKQLFALPRGITILHFTRF